MQDDANLKGPYGGTMSLLGLRAVLAQHVQHP